MAEQGIYKEKETEIQVQISLRNDHIFPYEISDLNGKYLDSCTESVLDRHYEYIGKRIPLIQPNINYENTPMETIAPLNLNPLTVNKDNITMKCEEIASLLIKKNHDYGNSVQEQFKDYGLTSILIRLEDKVRRLKHLQKNKQQVNDESLIDTLDDLAGYAVLGSICLEIEKGESK